MCVRVLDVLFDDERHRMMAGEQDFRASGKTSPHRHCERSEAIQTRAERRAEKSKHGGRSSPRCIFLARLRAQLDCFVASLLAMTAGALPASTTARFPAFYDAVERCGSGTSRTCFALEWLPLDV
jgi:hypothetical protein